MAKPFSAPALVGPAGAHKLRLWDLPEPDGRGAVSARPNTSGSWDRSSAKSATPRVHHGGCGPWSLPRVAAVKSSQSAERPHSTSSYDCDTSSFGFIGRQAKDAKIFGNLPSRGPSLGMAEPGEFVPRAFGTSAGSQVEEELRRLTALLKGLLREFAVVKDTVFHLEEQQANQTHVADHEENWVLETAKLSIMDLLEPIKERLSSLEDRQASVDCRVDLLDLRKDSVDHPIDSPNSRRSPEDVTITSLSSSSPLPPEKPTETSRMSPEEPAVNLYRADEKWETLADVMKADIARLREDVSLAKTAGEECGKALEALEGVVGDRARRGERLEKVNLVSIAELHARVECLETSGRSGSSTVVDHVELASPADQPLALQQFLQDLGKVKESTQLAQRFERVERLQEVHVVTTAGLCAKIDHLSAQVTAEKVVREVVAVATTKLAFLGSMGKSSDERDTPNRM